MAISQVEAPSWADDDGLRGRPWRVCFFYNGHLHQLLHSISIAAELAHKSGVHVEVWATSAEHLDYARNVVLRLGGGLIRYRLVGSLLVSGAAKLLGLDKPPKRLTLAGLALPL